MCKFGEVLVKRDEICAFARRCKTGALVDFDSCVRGDSFDCQQK